MKVGGVPGQAFFLITGDILSNVQKDTNFFFQTKSRLLAGGTSGDFDDLRNPATPCDVHLFADVTPSA